jgi:anti-sigma-K factor RskA
MGLASEEEVRILECVQQNNPEVRQAVLDAQKTMEDFASQQAVTPPPALKDAIWAKISDEKSAGPAVMPAAPQVEERVATPLYPAQSEANRSSSLRWLAIAATILLVLSISLNFYQNQTQTEYKNQLAALAVTQKSNQIAYQNLKSKWDLANSPNVKTVPLLGLENHPDKKAVVYFEQQSNNVYLALENMPVAPKDQQYQLWAIVDGKPVSLGVFDQDAEAAVQKMASVSSAQAFAITLEKRGGSATPTMENMYVMGKV